MIVNIKQIIVLIILAILLFGDVNKIIKNIKKNIQKLKETDSK